MGWFSDDSDEEEGPITKKAETDQQQQPLSDDEDPLDAYMNSLDHSSTGPSKLSHGGRLDHDAEDEATSHWEQKRTTAGGSSSRSLLLPSNQYDDLYQQHQDDVDGTAKQSAATREAKNAMSSTFSRAGTKRSHDKPSDHDDADEASLHEMAQQEITPLETINHNSIRYPPFRRTFHNPQNTYTGAQWRNQHNVTCTPPMDPILNLDTDVFPEELIKRIAKSGYDSLTLVQCQTLSVALAGRDGLITAATGSGKS